MGEVREALRVDSDLLAETVIVPPKRRAVSWWWVAVPVVLVTGWFVLRPKPVVIVPAPVARVALDKPRPTAEAPAPVVAARVTVPEGTRVRLALRTEIDRDAQAGMALEFTVTDGVTVGGQLVVAEGVVARGVLVGLEKKKKWAVVRLLTVEGLALWDGEEKLENQGPKTKTVVVSRGTTTVARTVGVQAVTASGR
jgi:hypothetical protein